MSLPEILTTARLTLRPVTPADGPAVKRHLGRIDVARMLTSIPHPYPTGMFEQWLGRIEREKAENGATYSIDHDGSLVGVASLGPHAGDALSLGYWFAPDAWGRGFATEAAEALRDAAFVETDAAELYARRLVDNAASGRILEKLGFVETGEMRHFSEARQESVISKTYRLPRRAWLDRALAAAPRLETKRLLLRPWTFEDVDFIMQEVGDLAISRWLAQVPHPYALRDARRFVASAARETRCGRAWTLGAEENGRLVGSVGIGALHSIPVIGWWMARAHWGRGLATEAADALLAHVFANGAARVRSGAFEGNNASLKIQKKLGFKIFTVRLRYNDARKADVRHFDTVLTREQFMAATKRTTL